MIKKILLIIFLFFINFNISFAVENPRWVSMPIYVYVPQYGNYTKLMKAAFNQWETQSDKLVRFEFVGRPEDANINVKFVREVKNCNSENAVGCSRMTVRSGRYYKNQLDIALMENFDQNSFRPINNIYGVMLHEIGHALGLGHTEENPRSIMFLYDLPSTQYLTKEDLYLLYKKYH